MESNKYNIENFEKFLRDKTDEFRMYPSKRVWYSIYNNMHPGNRLPSVSMSIILIGFLFLIGYLHTDISKHTSASTLNAAPANKQSLIAENNPVEANRQSIAIVIPSQVPAQLNTLAGNAIGDNQTAAVDKNNTRRVANTLQTISTAVNNTAIETAESDLQYSSVISANDNRNSLTENKTSITASPGSNNNLNVTTPPNTVVLSEMDITTVASATPLTGKEESISTTKEDTKEKTDNTLPVTKSNKVIAVSQSNKAWMEDFAMHNRPVAKKWAGKLSLQAYITPSVVYRNLHNNAPDKVAASPSLGTGTNIENSITHKPSFGIETGMSLQYDIAKKIKIKAGVQFNYTRYNAHAYNTDHPTGTSITMNSTDNILAYESFRTSYYSNAFGLSAAKLHNETYQLSIPIGADIKLAGVDNLAWYAGATIQPTIVLYSNSYIISTDRRSYVQDPSLLNRFNLNAGFETYISYRSASGYTWQLGPQYRTQIFSTNTKLYTVEERLQNFGFKIGVTKRL